MLGGEQPTGRAVKAEKPTTAVHVPGKSDEGVVPMNRRRPAGRGEREGRPETEGNPNQTMRPGTQGPDILSNGLARVRQAAERDGNIKFTALFHHITPAFLEECFRELNPKASPGVDWQTWSEYEGGVHSRLADLNERVHAGTYRAQPSRRVWIPKADGRQRPLGVAALEDKIVQRAVGRILEAIYEADFERFSYGFRPGRSQHDALDALWTALTDEPVNWILDADIQGFFDALDHEWLMKFLEHRIADPRILRLIRKWLKAGVCEEGKWTGTTQGVPQGR